MDLVKIKKELEQMCTEIENVHVEPKKTKSDLTNDEKEELEMSKFIHWLSKKRIMIIDQIEKIKESEPKEQIIKLFLFGYDELKTLLFELSNTEFEIKKLRKTKESTDDILLFIFGSNSRMIENDIEFLKLKRERVIREFKFNKLGIDILDTNINHILNPVSIPDTYECNGKRLQKIYEMNDV